MGFSTSVLFSSTQSCVRTAPTQYQLESVYNLYSDWVSGYASKGMTVKLSFGKSKAFCASSDHLNLAFFLVRAMRGSAIWKKFGKTACSTLCFP